MLVPPVSLKSLWTRKKAEGLSDSAYAELVALLLCGRLPIAVMALTIMVVGLLAYIETPSLMTSAYAAAIVILLGFRALIVTLFMRAAKSETPPHAIVRLWEVRYVRAVLPYAALRGLFNLHVVTTGGEHVRLLVVAETFGFCAGMVSRGFVRPQLCTLMVLMGALPSAAGFLIVAIRASSGAAALSYVIVGSLFAVYAVSSLETVRHLYRAMIGQLATKRELGAFARVDPLTGLANRLAMREKLAGEENRPGGPKLFALLLIDLDGFKAVNDSYGHPAGDRLLKEVGRRLTAAMREDDLAVRLGGDEFCIIQTRLSKAADAEALGNRLLAILKEPFLDNGTALQVGSSIGIVIEDGTIGNIDALVERADSALYRAKRLGGNTLRLWRSAPILTLAA